ncbi:30S ribosomal protein S16 [uncultured Gimesia sp.]|uniref:30S ribosomal protein S16 n=1 Tax=uncultured Gimesia sp. TaxID=1678688 RepID=UPI003452762F
MAVKIRMKRMGRKHRPFYRICVMDSRKQRDGAAIEEIGTYDTSVADKSKRVTINMERVDYWMSVGAKPSDNVATLIKKVKQNKFGTAAAPAPLIAPKEPAPEPEPETQEESADTAEASSEEAATPEAETPSE